LLSSNSAIWQICRNRVNLKNLTSFAESAPKIKFDAPCVVLPLNLIGKNLLAAQTLTNLVKIAPNLAARYRRILLKLKSRS